MSKHTIRTWANGFGVWHARITPAAGVTLTPSQVRRIGHRAILDEILTRAPRGAARCDVRTELTDVLDNRITGDLSYTVREAS